MEVVREKRGRKRGGDVLFVQIRSQDLDVACAHVVPRRFSQTGCKSGKHRIFQTQKRMEMEKMNMGQKCSGLYRNFCISFLHDGNSISVNTQQREAKSIGEKVGPQIRQSFAVCR